MSNFYTTRELQALLQVDRTTIYRLADAGRVPAVKVGNQWRFPRQQVEHWLQSQDRGGSAAAAPASAADLRALLPLDCVQLMQETFAEALGVTVLIADLNGVPVTEPSNPCGLFTAIERWPAARRRCMERWSEFARQPGLQPAFLPSPVGLLCARGLIRVGSTLMGMVVVGGLAPAEWPPDEARLEGMAAELGLPRELLQTHLLEVYRMAPEGQERLLHLVQRIADVVSHIVQERSLFHSKLQNIAELTKF